MVRVAQKRSVVIVDDHPFLRDGVRRFLNEQVDLEVCGEAEDVVGAFACIERLVPDLVLLDMRLGNGDVIELIKALKVKLPNVKLLVFSHHEESYFAERSLRAGAHGYLIKSEHPDEFLYAIRRVLQDDLYVSRRVAGPLLGKLLHNPTSGGALNRVEGLSDREFQVFRMLGAGLNNRQISEELKLSIKTIETYRENIKHKFGLRTSSELLRQAVQWLHDSAKPGTVAAAVVEPACAPPLPASGMPATSASTT